MYLKFTIFCRTFVNLDLNQYEIVVPLCGGAGWPKLTWKKLTEKDCREWKLTTVDPQERSTLRSGVRSAMHAASQ